MIRSGILIFAVMLTACMSVPSKQASEVTIVPAKDVQACQFLGYVFGDSELTNLASEVGIVNAKYEAQEHAAQIGATHLVWAQVQATWDVSSSVTGSAYRCG